MPVRLSGQPITSRVGVLQPVVVSGGGGAWAPTDVSGLVAWYAADEITGKVDGDPISQWDDLSGNGRHLVQATSAARPTYKTNRQNSLPGVLTDAVDDAIRYAVGTAFISGSTLTLAIVHKRHTWIGNDRIVTLHNASGPDWNMADGFTLTAEASTANRLYRGGSVRTAESGANAQLNRTLIWFDGTNANHRLNNAAASTPSGASTGSFGIKEIRLATSDVAFNGDFYELALWDNDIGSTERGNWETYSERWVP